MRRVISILFLSLMLLQAIPVLHFFSSNKAIFYAYIDEEKPDEKVKKEGKESFSITLIPTFEANTKKEFSPYLLNQYSSPLLEALTPPPDAC
jgi:hypothetical protein